MWELASQIAKQGVGNLFFHKGKAYFCAGFTIASESIAHLDWENWDPTEFVY